MSDTIKIGIAGYGNLGRGVELALAKAPDMALAGVFTRRNPAELKLATPTATAHSIDRIGDYRSAIDVLILCGGSKSDLPVQGPQLAALFNTVDSYDTHAKIPDYYAAVDEAARQSGHVALISIGWDPGLFSLNRLLGEAILPDGDSYTFWGKGLSQGHSDALRRVDGVAAAVQYTLPSQDAMRRVRSGERPALATREKHVRECFVVLKDGVDPQAIEHTIKTMPDYFADYDTTVHFISLEELRRDHAAMPHGGHVIRSGTSGQNTRQTMEFALQLDSNPEFTSSVIVAYARAAHRLAQQGQRGAKTIFDIPPGLLSPKSPAELRKELL